MKTALKEGIPRSSSVTRSIPNANDNYWPVICLPLLEWLKRAKKATMEELTSHCQSQPLPGYPDNLVKNMVAWLCLHNYVQYDDTLAAWIPKPEQENE